jgi:hypothetical protein
LSAADIRLHPQINKAHWSELLRYREFIEAGIKEAEDKLPQIRTAVRKK